MTSTVHTEYDPDAFYVLAAEADRFKTWLAERGGLAVWVSQALELMGRSWTTPLRAEDGTPAPRPHWSCKHEPDRVITDPAEVFVAVEEAVRDFRRTTDKNVNSILSRIGRGSRVDYAAGKYLRFVRGVPILEFQPEATG
jgi:hypothetical protein